MLSIKSKQMIVLFFAVFLMFIPYPSYEEPQVSAFYENAALSDKLNVILTDEKLNGALAGVSVRSAETGELIYENDGDLRLKPASNMKLLTGAAALETLGTDYTFTTEVLADGERKGNGKMLQGDLYLKGKGDPTLMAEDLEAMAQSLKEKGIRQITGDLIADDTWYDDIRLSEDISWNDETNYTAAQISALTVSPNEDYDAGTVIVEAHPSNTKGEPAEIIVTPENDYVEIINKAETVAEDQEKDISIERTHGTNQIVIEGEIPVDGSRSRSWVAVDEPAGLALDLFHEALEEQGIKIKGEERTGKTPKAAELLVSKDSMPVEDLFIPFMKLSNNGHAEVLVKEMGRVVHEEGSWDKGLQVVEEFLADNGVNADTLRLRDGSGMSHVNNVPANEFSKLLYEVQEKDWFPAYLKSLPVAGDSDRFVGGTLRNRFDGTAAEGNIQAKTGSITAVTSLSGYVTTKDGEELVFSIVLNNYLGSVRAIEDKIAVTLAEHESE
ncbi:D-alanyl-D-alanine carboxypeptidase/D-alanyl-D-alanine-endopeptidase [Halobacillus sp. Marseille-Q1614]|uniref:D-alanyl-D-alanine carboxypeptidase/D-alanyl-D-alanine endopeptidase n=1 Tax=Halobacillus sp. Marseille-Q1614 TaxID=2709134 RepID=UPI0015711BA5|nr:D-alanyl-D-alanine carboxypeptidase/D-alanyl-D-alanine-endopeptidase [Halobacillus sp. Marseille-Q1614]